MSCFAPESELTIQNLILFPFLLLHEALYKQLTAVKLEVSIVSMTALLFHPCRCTNSGEKISERPALQIPLLHLSKPQRTKLSFVISSCRPSHFYCVSCLLLYKWGKKTSERCDLQIPLLHLNKPAAYQVLSSVITLFSYRQACKWILMSKLCLYTLCSPQTLV